MRNVLGPSHRPECRWVLCIYLSSPFSDYVFPTPCFLFEIGNRNSLLAEVKSQDNFQGRRNHLKSGGEGSGQVKKPHMTTPINGQNSNRFESTSNQVHTVFGWESTLGCISKTAISHRKFQRLIGRIECSNFLPK